MVKLKKQVRRMRILDLKVKFVRGIFLFENFSWMRSLDYYCLYRSRFTRIRTQIYADPAVAGWVRPLSALNLLEISGNQLLRIDNSETIASQTDFLLRKRVDH